MLTLKPIARAAAAALLAISAAAQADVAYQSIPDLYASPDVNGWCSDCFANQRIAQQFTLTSDATIQSALFTVTSSFVWPTSVTVSIYADTGSSSLGSQLFVQTYSSVALDNDTGHDTRVVGVNIPSLSLAAGTYNFFIVNPDGLAIPGYSGVGAGTQIAIQDSTGLAPAVGTSYYYIGGFDGALALQTTPVPEASTLAMLSAGLGVLALLRRRVAAA